MSNTIDKRVNSEAAKLRREISQRADDVRDDLCEDIKCLQQQIDELPLKLSDSEEQTERSLNFCIRNHPQTQRENVNTVVFDLLRDGLNLRDIGFKKAVRKDRDDHKPGVIIVTCKKVEDKTLIMQRKKQLKNSRRYQKVYIHADQSVETRVNNSNLKMLISALGVTGLRMKGSRLVADNSNIQEARNDHRRERTEPTSDISDNRSNSLRHLSNCRDTESTRYQYRSSTSDRRRGDIRDGDSSRKNNQRQHHNSIHGDTHRYSSTNSEHSRRNKHGHDHTSRYTNGSRGS